MTKTLGTRKALAVAVLMTLAPLPGATQETLQKQLDAAIWPIRTALPDNEFTDLAPLEGATGSSRIVALGEATHGTSEFYELKTVSFGCSRKKADLQSSPWRR